LWESVETDLKYSGYVTRQNAAIERLRNSEGKKIPTHLDFQRIPGLRAETRQKLEKVRPETMGQASRISGITPADLALLSIVLERPLPTP
jgi:tRNA uridine 5-carboxymethylaminomethyl modification enzyme